MATATATATTTTTEPSHFDIGTPDGEGRKLAHSYEIGKLFEAKDAKFLPEFNGEDKAGLWRRKVSAYLITKYPEMADGLEWVERKQVLVDNRFLKKYKRVDHRDSVALAQHLWDF